MLLALKRNHWRNKMKVEFQEQGHLYLVNGNLAELSTTELLHKHKLSPDYSGVDIDILTAKAEFGKEIHEELSFVTNRANYEPLNDYGVVFKEYFINNFKFGIGEQLIGLIYKDLIISGSIDFIGRDINDKNVIMDYKFTAKKDINYWTWQQSLYNYMLKKLGKEPINGVVLDWKGADISKVLWWSKDTATFKEVNLTLYSDEEVEELLECEVAKEIYKRKELALNEELELRVKQAEEQFMFIETEYKKAKDLVEETRKELLSIFKKQNIIKWETDKFSVSYVQPSTRETIDSGKLRVEYPQVYDKVYKVSEVKEYLKVTKKKEKNEDI